MMTAYRIVFFVALLAVQTLQVAVRSNGLLRPQAPPPFELLPGPGNTTVTTYGPIDGHSPFEYMNDPANDLLRISELNMQPFPCPL